MSLEPEVIDSNWKQFRSMCEKTGPRAPAIRAMLDELDERLALCPASAKRDFHSAFPGGLVDHSLRVLKNLLVLNSGYGWGLPKQSMIIGALFHDIGKVGFPGKGAEMDFYVPQKDAWRVDKLGEEYTYNDAVAYMTTPDRSVFLMQHYGIQLSADEWLAIKLNDGFVYEPNKQYCLKIGQLVFGVQTADYIATCEESKKGWMPEK
jgi:hypothetical protein